MRDCLTSSPGFIPVTGALANSGTGPRTRSIPPRPRKMPTPTGKPSKSCTMKHVQRVAGVFTPVSADRRSNAVAAFSYSKSLYGHYHPWLRRPHERTLEACERVEPGSKNPPARDNLERRAHSDIRATRFSRQILKSGGVPDRFRTEARTPRSRRRNERRDLREETRRDEESGHELEDRAEPKLGAEWTAGRSSPIKAST